MMGHLRKESISWVETRKGLLRIDWKLDLSLQKAALHPPQLHQ
jgi:hypothetical protein